MEFGVSIPTPADAWKTAKRAEDAGYRTAWFYDTQLLSADVFVGMGAAAMKTDRIRLATGVLIPSNRIAPSAANAFASLNALAPGRIDAGIGTGYTGRRTMGLGPYKLADMGEYIRIMQAMWRGETPEIRIEGKTRKVRFLNPDAKLINIDDEIPVYVSAFGPKARRLTAEVGAHWINVDFTEDLAAQAAKDMDRLYAEAGQDPKKKRKVVFLWGSVLKEGEAYDSPRIKAETGPFAVMMLHNAMEAQDHGDLVESAAPDNEIARLAPEYRKTVYDKYQPAETRYLNLHRGHLMFVRPEEERFATAELIRTATITGTVSELRDRMRLLKDAGYDEVVVQVTPGHDTMVEDWARVFEGV
jgi:5,10-methylenetetrahydromethanopterin reductase